MKEKLLLLHGALGSKRQFSRFKQGLEKTFDLYEMNFEGHGGRPSDQDFTMDLFSENVVDFLTDQDIDEVTIFGYSMGGYVALNTALKQPKLVKRIITLGTKFDWNIKSSEQEVKMLDPEKIELKVPHFAKKLKADHHPNDWKEVLRKTGKMMLEMGKGRKLLANDFGKIKIPVVLGIGDLDRMVSIEETEQVHSWLSKSRIIYLEGVKHELEKIEPKILCQFIIDQAK